MNLMRMEFKEYLSEALSGPFKYPSNPRFKNILNGVIIVMNVENGQVLRLAQHKL